MIKRLLSIILVIAFMHAAVIAGGLNAIAFFNGDTEQTDAFSNYIVTFREDADIASLLENTSYRVISKEQRVYLLETDDIEYFAAYCEYAENDYTRKTLEADVKWEYEYCNISEGQKLSGKGKGLVVAVLDTGIDRRHAAFTDTVILDGYDATTDTDFVDSDYDGHGTAVAGIIAARDGIVPEAQIYPVKISDGTGIIYSSCLTAGIYRAVDEGADIINISAGGYSYSVAEKRAVEYAVSKGCIIVAAAGNDGADSSLAGKYYYPASYDGVISVASVENDGTISKFSQYNDKIDVAAPGRDITVCLTSGDNMFGTSSGTSFSAAIVSGIAALAENSAGGLNADQFLHLIISACGSNKNVYSGYGIINCEDIVIAAEQPIVTGVYNNAVLNSPTVITFNKGSARLDGKPFSSGDTVSQKGKHVLSLFHEDKTTNISFTLAEENLEYTVSKNAILFQYGKGYLDGVPYTSGTAIAAGIHRFKICGLYSSKEVTVNIGFNAHILGAEDGITYPHPVCLTTYGDAVFDVNGKSFTGTKLLSDGDYTALIKDKDGAVASYFTFSVKTDKHSIKGFEYDKYIYADENFGYLAVSGAVSGAVRIYNSDNLSVPLRTIKVTGNVTGISRHEDKLLIFTEDNIFCLDANAVNGAETPVLSVYSETLPQSGYVIAQNKVYSGDKLILETSFGNVISVDGGRAYTERAIVDISTGEVLRLFYDELISVSGGFALVKGTGLVEFENIELISALPCVYPVYNGNSYNAYTSAALLGVTAEDVCLDGKNNKIFVLSQDELWYTNTDFSESGRIGLRFIPRLIASGGGKCIAFFEEGYCVIDTATFEKVYYSECILPEKAAVSEFGIAVSYGDRIKLITDRGTTMLEDVPVKDIAVYGNNLFIANDRGIGVFDFNGNFAGSIDSGDTDKLYTDGIYVSSRDSVYLVSDGSLCARMSDKVIGINSGLVFTESGVFAPFGEKLSESVYNGIHANGICISAENGYIGVNGSENTGKIPEISVKDDIYDNYAEIFSDIGLIYIDGVYFGNVLYTVGGEHIYECVMPFGIIYSGKFSVIPELEGISVSGDWEMSVGESKYISVEYLPYGASSVPLAYSVVGTAVTVNEQGLVTAVEEGSATIIVSAGQRTAEVAVTVNSFSVSFEDEKFSFYPESRTVFIPANTTRQKLSDVLMSDCEYFSVLSQDGTELESVKYLGSGCVIKFFSASAREIAKVTVVVSGDANGDGILTAADVFETNMLLSGIEPKLYQIYAVDSNDNGIIDNDDLMKLITEITLYNQSLSENEKPSSVTMSIPATVHPAGEFAVIMYVDGGVGVDSAAGTLLYDADTFELLYAEGVNYKLYYTDNGGTISFAAHDPNFSASDRAIKTFGVAMFRVKEEVSFKNYDFTLNSCSVTINGEAFSTGDTAKRTQISKRSASEFSITIPNAEFFVFNPSIRNYYVNVPYDAVALELLVDYPDGGIVSCTETIIPENDELTVIVRYTSPQGVSTNYKIYVTRESERKPENNAFLQTITFTSGTLSPEFISERLSYRLLLSYDDPDPVIGWKTVSENAAASADIPKVFPVGSTDVVITCVAEDGTEIKYTVTVVREKQPEPNVSDIDDDIGNGGLTLKIIIISAAVVTVLCGTVVIFVGKGKKNVKKIK